MNLKQLFLEDDDAPKGPSPLLEIMPQLNWRIFIQKIGGMGVYRTSDLARLAADAKKAGLKSVPPYDITMTTEVGKYENTDFFEPLHQYYHPELDKPKKEEEPSFHTDDEFGSDEPELLGYELMAVGFNNKIDVDFMADVFDTRDRMPLTPEEHKWIVDFYQKTWHTLNGLMGATI